MNDPVDNITSSFGYVFNAFLSAIAFGVIPFFVVVLAVLLLLLIKVPGFQQNSGRILAFGFIGIFLGMFTGGSKEPVVAAVLPAAIGLISSVTIYFFEKKEGAVQSTEAPAISAMLCFLVISASFGVYYASNIRVLSVRKEQAIELNREIQKFEQMEIKVKLDRVKICLEMFATEPNIKTACTELLKAK